MWGIQLAENLNLLLYVLDLILGTLKVDYLDCDSLLRTFVVTILLSVARPRRNLLCLPLVHLSE
jgi:hypothetical protein